MPNDAEMPGLMVDTPLAERVQTFLRHLRSGGRDLSDDVLASSWWTGNPRFPSLRADFAAWWERLGDFAVVAYESRQPYAATALIVDSSDRHWRCPVVIGADPPHLILGSAVFPSPPGVTAREARPTDAGVLRDIERRTPLVVGDARLFYDRGADYFAGERLMGDVEMFVVERAGVVLGVAGRAFPEVRIGGQVFRALYSHRLRLLPEAQGSGVRGPLNALQMEGGMVAIQRGCVDYGFVAEGNDAALRTIQPERRWKIGAVRLILDTGQVAGVSAGRAAGHADAARLVDLFNDMHSDEELFVPHTVASLTERLQRESSAYSWNNITRSDHAAVGIWPARLGVRREHAGIVTEDVRALVLDYGCDPGAEGDLVTLVRSACASLCAQGITELSLFSSPPARGFREFAALAKRAEPYVVACWSPPGPELERRGVYVDQLYF